MRVPNLDRLYGRRNVDPRFTHPHTGRCLSARATLTREPSTARIRGVVVDGYRTAPSLLPPNRSLVLPLRISSKRACPVLQKRGHKNYLSPMFRICIDILQTFQIFVGHLFDSTGYGPPLYGWPVLVRTSAPIVRGLYDFC